MGWRLAEEVQRHAPGDLTWRELYALSTLANYANDQTRLITHGIENKPDLCKRLRLGKRERAAVLARLVTKGALIHVKRGHSGTRAEYAIPHYQKDAATSHPNDRSSVREQQQQGAESTAAACEASSASVRESRTPSRHPVSPGKIPSRARARVAPQADMIETVQEAIKARTGFEISKDWAGRICSDILGSRKPRYPADYCRKAIENEHDPAARFLPHPGPPPAPAKKAQPVDSEAVKDILDETRQKMATARVGQ